MSKKSNEKRKKLKKNLKKQRVDNHSLPQNPSSDYVSPNLIERTKPEVIININKGRGKKYSEIIAEYIELDQLEGLPLEEIKEYTQVGILFWNLSTMRQLGDNQKYNEVLEKVDNKEDFIELMNEHEKRKIRFFKDDKFIVTDYEIKMIGKWKPMLFVAVFDINKDAMLQRQKNI
jgi:hypothetical protein